MKKTKTPAEPAAKTGQAAQFAIVDILTVQASPTNPRKTFPSESLTALSQNIKRVGILQPLLIRPWPAYYEHPEPRPVYEIVAGERRWRAAALADLTVIPVTIRDLTDVEVLEIQVIENLQREEVHPLEEAEGFDLLLQSGYTVDTLAEKINKSRAYIYARLKLIALAPEARKSFFAGDLNPSTALLVARIPLHDMQAQAITEITEGKWKEGPMSARQAAEHIRNHYMLKLNGMPFYDPTYAPLTDVPHCRDCPNRTGNQPEIYPDVDADVCTNSRCFNNKKTAHKDHQEKAATANGLRVFTGTDAEKIAPYGIIGNILKRGYRVLDEKCYERSPVNGVFPTYRELGGDDFQASALIENSAGDLVEIAQIDDINAALKARGEEEINVTKTSASEREQARQLKIDNAFRALLFDAIHQKLSEEMQKFRGIPGATDDHNRPVGFSHENTLLVVTSFFHTIWHEYQKQLAKKWMPNSEKKGHELVAEFTNTIPTMDYGSIAMLLIETAIISERTIQIFTIDHKPEKMLALAVRHNIDVDAIRQQVVNEKQKTPKGEK